MSFARSKLEPDIKSPRPTSRIGKLAVIREVFADQGKIISDGEVKLTCWDAREQNQYLESIGLTPTAKNKARTDEELDLIIADLERHKMILFK